MRDHDKRPLYRKVNTTAHAVLHQKGGSYSDARNTRMIQQSSAVREGMHANQRRGLDYTPLFKFLLSRIGEPWDGVCREAVSRLDRPDPIFWMVALREHERRPYFRIGESSLFSGLYVDDEGRLQMVDPSLGPSSLTPSCKCCTHTFNGIRFTRRFEG